MGTQHSPNWHSPQLLAHVCCGQTAQQIKMPLDRDVGLGPGDILSDGVPTPPPKKKWVQQPPLFGQCVLWLNGWMDQDATWYAGRPRPRPHCFRWDPVLPNKRSTAAPLLAHVYCGQTARRIKISLGTELGLGHRPHFLRQRPNSPTERGTAPPLSAHVYCGQTVAHLSNCWALVLLVLCSTLNCSQLLSLCILHHFLCRYFTFLKINIAEHC